MNRSLGDLSASGDKNRKHSHHHGMMDFKAGVQFTGGARHGAFSSDVSKKGERSPTQLALNIDEVLVLLSLPGADRGDAIRLFPKADFERSHFPASKKTKFYPLNNFS